MTAKKKSIKKAGRTRKKPLTPRDRAKLRVARDLGLYEHVKEQGWGGLSAKECGRVGGTLSQKLRQERSRQLRNARA